MSTVKNNRPAQPAYAPFGYPLSGGDDKFAANLTVVPQIPRTFWQQVRNGHDMEIEPSRRREADQIIRQAMAELRRQRVARLVRVGVQTSQTVAGGRRAPEIEPEDE